MTQLEALRIAFDELSDMMPYEGENDEVFEAANIIEKMIEKREMQSHKCQMRNAPRAKEDRRRMKEINNAFNDLLSDL